MPRPAGSIAPSDRIRSLPGAHPPPLPSNDTATFAAAWQRAMHPQFVLPSLLQAACVPRLRFPGVSPHECALPNHPPGLRVQLHVQYMATTWPVPKHPGPDDSDHSLPSRPLARPPNCCRRLPDVTDVLPDFGRGGHRINLAHCSTNSGWALVHAAATFRISRSAGS